MVPCVTYKKVHYLASSKPLHIKKKAFFPLEEGQPTLGYMAQQMDQQLDFSPQLLS